MLNAVPLGNPYQAYKQVAVETAPPERLLLMLYDGAIRFLTQAKDAMEKRDYETSNKWLGKVQDIFSELMITLDLEQGEIAENLYKLYDFYKNELIMANVEKNVQRLQPVAEFLEMFRDTWSEAANIVLEDWQRNEKS